MFAGVCYRNRQSGESKYVAKLSLDELQCFSDQVSNLPCVIAETKLIQVRSPTYVQHAH